MSNFLRKEVEKILVEFWVGKCPNGSYHACTLPNMEVEEKVPPVMRRITVEEATKRLMDVIERFHH